LSKSSTCTKISSTSISTGTNVTRTELTKVSSTSTSTGTKISSASMGTKISSTRSRRTKMRTLICIGAERSRQ